MPNSNGWVQQSCHPSSSSSRTYYRTLEHTIPEKEKGTKFHFKPTDLSNKDANFTIADLLFSKFLQGIQARVRMRTNLTTDTSISGGAKPIWILNTRLRLHSIAPPWSSGRPPQKEIITNNSQTKKTGPLAISYLVIYCHNNSIIFC